MSDPSSSSSRPRGGGATPESAGTARRGSGLFGWLWQRDRGETDLRGVLGDVLDGHGEAGAAIGPEHREMLENIISLGDLQVDDVMVPRADIKAIDVQATLAELIESFREARHSRLPVFRDNLDDIVGYVHLKDIVDHWGDGENFRLRASLHKLIAVPPAMPVLELLQRMRQARQHMAIVVDEYGGTDGLVTIEDVVEAIVGDIDDEHDEEVPMLVEMPDGSWAADGRLELETFEQTMGVDLLPDDLDDEIDTLGGLIFHLLGRVPKRGDTIEHETSGFAFEVTDADARRIKRLTVRRLPAAPAVPDDSD
ncbi:MAG: hemolysin family protein [Alphaproteobacteria bacterium]